MAGISILSWFDYRGQLPNFSRDVFNSVDEMVEFNENYLPDIFIANVIENGKTYKYQRSNSLDESLGRWRELEGGGSADLSARRSVALNELEDKIEIVTGDMKEAVDIFGAASFHVITMNPPYMTGNHGLVNPGDAKAIARHEITCTLEEMISQASKVLKSKGRFYMVHRPFRLAEIMSLMIKHHLEPKRMRLVYPYVDKEPHIVLIEWLKAGNSRITVEPPLIVYDAPGVYTEELKRMYYEV